MTVVSKRVFAAAVGLALWAASTQAAMAGVINWAFSYSGLNVDGYSTTASGTITTSDVVNPNFPGGYDILAITGTRNGIAITGIVPPTAVAAPVLAFGFEYNNILYPSEPFFDEFGMLYAADDDFLYNVWFEAETETYWESFYDTDGLVNIPLTEGSITRVPEPTSLMLIAFSLLSLFGFGLLRQRRA
ncbi:MAG: PEP-CTERM sorting domain-containing protein [Alphaproteobacteria bacterium]|nr:PEP-CTERM sorting domain-containing protein [Alphaproteobacteria bacterium]